MLTTSLAGCTGGDPDAGGNDEFDAETLQGMIEAGLQDFMNNTTVEITNNYYTNETSTTTNNVNGSGGVSSSSLHALSGTDPGESSFVVSYSGYNNTLALLVRADAYPAAPSGYSAAGLDGANICVGVSSAWEYEIVDWFSSRNIAFTTVPIADLAEANAKFIDGSCDAMAGEMEYLEIRQTVLTADGWLERSQPDHRAGLRGLLLPACRAWRDHPHWHVHSQLHESIRGNPPHLRVLH